MIRDRIKELRRVPASSILPHPNNWRTHPPAQRQALRAMLNEVGIAGAVLAYEADGRLHLIDGHLRTDELGDAEIPVLVLDVTEAEADKLLATIDPIGAMASKDDAALKALLDSVTLPDDDLSQHLYSIIEPPATDLPSPGAGGDEFDATPEAAGPTRTSPGDLWLIGGKHRLLVDDCTVAATVARLMAGVKADCIVTDPPYGVDFQRGQFITDPTRPAASRGVGDGILGDHRKGQDQHDFIRDVFVGACEHCRVGASVYMWSANLAEGSHSMLGLAAAGVHIHNQLVWVKNNLVLGQCDYQWKHELCWYGWYSNGSHRWFGGRDKTTILEFARLKSTEHPNQKPVEMIGCLISNSTLPGESVLDPFLGSGTTLIAAHRLGRVCHGCEIDPRYADIILKRAEAEGLSVELLK